MILMLSGAAMPQGGVWKFQLEADDLLGQPVRLEEFVLRVLASAGRQPDVRTRVLRRADIELDPLRHVAWRAGRVLHLSAKEFAVLQALMRTQAVLSAEALLEQVWDEHADPFTNVVKVTMSRLRRRLGPPAVIETVPRVGYRLSETLTGKTERDERARSSPGAGYINGTTLHVNGDRVAREQGTGVLTRRWAPKA